MFNTPGISRIPTDQTERTAVDRQPAPSTRTVPRTYASSFQDSVSYSPIEPEKRQTHQRFVFADPVAFRYLEDDPSTDVLARRERLQGYECYLVEQWACSRKDPTFIITTYSGDPNHSIVVSVLSVPADEKAWSPRLRTYYKALSQYHARGRETPLGILMTTNLSSFPSSLTVIPIPEGDPKSNRVAFFVNENLKRLGCSGRVGLTLAAPHQATKSKFYQLYRTSSEISFDASVIELVKLCQVALILFDKLQTEYADGLLCDVTEKAINDWWIEFGTEHYSVEPHDGVLGPSTVAALLGMVIGARNRLHASGAPVSKDVFDVETTKRAIAYFQKSQHIPKTRRLDRQTLSRLHRQTSKAATGDGWLVPRAVKSTVAELSGKGGEMVMDIVRPGKEKAGIGEVETTDIEHFVSLIQGDRCKWLWRGKKWKHSSGADTFKSLPDEEPMFQHGDTSTHDFARLKRGPTLEPSPDFGDMERVTTQELDDRERNRLSKKPPQRMPSQRANEGGRGLGRIKDAVGLRSHHKQSAKDNKHRQLSPGSGDHTSSPKTAAYDRSPVNDAERPSITRSIESNMAVYRRPTIIQTPAEVPDLTEVDARFRSTLDLNGDQKSDQKHATGLDGQARSQADTASRSPSASLPDSQVHLPKSPDLSAVDLPDSQIGVLLRRTQSFADYEKSKRKRRNSGRYPRQLSFSIAEDSILTWKPIQAATIADSDDADTSQQIIASLLARTEAQSYSERLNELEKIIGTWVSSQVTAVHSLETDADRNQQQLDELYYPRSEEFHALEHASRENLREEHARLDREVTEIEVLGAKLEYEINALRGRVEDTEDGVDEFERQVRQMEDRVLELERKMRYKEGWLHWMLRMTTGIGSAPPARRRSYR